MHQEKAYSLRQHNLSQKFAENEIIFTKYCDDQQVYIISGKEENANLRITDFQGNYPMHH